jgi:hypothetical protein
MGFPQMHVDFLNSIFYSLVNLHIPINEPKLRPKKN